MFQQQHQTLQPLHVHLGDARQLKSARHLYAGQQPH